MPITIPDPSLVVLIGVSGSGKSTFARKHFRPTEILSSDFFRGLVSDDENDQSATTDAFDVLHYVAAKRLAAGRLVVVDATNVQESARRPLVALAREHDVLAIAIVLDLPERVCEARNRTRPDRAFGPHVIRRQSQELRRSLRGLQREGFRYVTVLSSPEEIDAMVVERQPLWTNQQSEHGPFDIIGDVHACFDELNDLLVRLDYQVQHVEGDGEPPRYEVRPPNNRKLIFLGDLIDRGPNPVETLRLVMDAVASGVALCIPGNHDDKLKRKLDGRNVQLNEGLAETVEALDREPPGFRERVRTFLDGLISHYVLDNGKLVVAHAGMPANLQGRASGRVRDFALYGATTGEKDEYGLPVRLNWASDYKGKAMVVYGHTPQLKPEWLNNTINIDTGCVYGGSLTALRYPERELVSVPCRREYAQSKRLEIARAEASKPRTIQQAHDDLLDLDDVLGRRIVETRLHGRVTVAEENATTALEVMSRFAVDPRWLIYLPPTMSPPETSNRPDLLEHPDEAFAYFRREGVARVICEEKHMGSRAVVVVGKDGSAVARRFGVDEKSGGIVFSRTGRRFFDDALLEGALIERLRGAIDVAGLWTELQTDWLCLDCELMPWSVKAQELLRRQYAAVGAAGRAALSEVNAVLDQTADQTADVGDLLSRYADRADLIARFAMTYRKYCWPVTSLADLKLAPFHLLASEGATHVERDHRWHLGQLARICQADPTILLATAFQEVDLSDEASQSAAVAWWEHLTGAGGEGMVVKPLDYVSVGPRGLIQPAMKCRGREYLRLIYGPDYTTPDNLTRLRRRALGHKRSLAAREFALGVEALERFVRGEPLRRVHECVFGVLALESEPTDPRL
jgi:protein phosphatase